MWQTELLRSPAVRVGPSSLGEGAGDGVFAARKIKQGETVTWSEQMNVDSAFLEKWTSKEP